MTLAARARESRPGRPVTDFPLTCSDDYMVMLTEVSDVAGNVSFGGNIFNHEATGEPAPAEVLLLDNTPRRRQAS